jgi:glycosyltransferase involved in cell wall biosynthesis
MQKRIAIVLHAGIGGGHFSQGQPAIGKVVEQLACDFDVIVYSKLRPDCKAKFPGFKVYSAPDAIGTGWFRWLYLVVSIMLNHIRKPHHLFYSFWGYPAGFIATCLGKVLNKPSIIHLQGGDATRIDSLEYGVFYRTFSKKLSAWAYRKTSLLIALTAFQKHDLRRNGIYRRVEIIPYGPDLKIFRLNENKFSGDIVRFIHIGNHTPVKDQKTLLDAFNRIVRKIEKCRLKFVGYDAFEGELKNYAIQLGIDQYVEFVGPVPYNQIPHLLFDADIMLHTSIYEGQATVISEAAACGVLLAGTRVGLLADLGDDFGLIVNVGDADNLAEKVLGALVEKGRVKEYVRRARKWVEKHDHKWTVETIKTHLTYLMKA